MCKSTPNATEQPDNSVPADNADETPASVSTPEDSVMLTASEAKFLRRFALTLKTRATNVMRNRVANKLEVIKDCAAIREEAAMIYEVLTDALWRELKETDNNA